METITVILALNFDKFHNNNYNNDNNHNHNNITVKNMNPICNYISQVFENIMTTTMFSNIEVYSNKNSNFRTFRIISLHLVSKTKEILD